MKGESAIGTFAVQLMLLSLVAVGGVNTIVPELHRQVVDIAHWLTDQQFADLFALAQAAPARTSCS